MKQSKMIHYAMPLKSHENEKFDLTMIVFDRIDVAKVKNIYLREMELMIRSGFELKCYIYLRKKIEEI